MGKLITLEDTGIFHITRQCVISYKTHYAIAITITLNEIPDNEIPALTFPDTIGACVLPFEITPDCGGIMYSGYDSRLYYRAISSNILTGAEIIINGNVPKKII